MAQKTIQSDNFNYTVEAVPSLMRLPSGDIVNDGFTVNRRTDTLEVLGKCSDRYGIIQNNDLISIAEDSFKIKGLTDYTRKAVVTGAGEKMRVIYDFKNKTRKMAVGDEIGFRLQLQNSFDGSLRASFALGSLRLICLNGATSLQNESSLTKKHSTGISVDFVTKALEKAILSWDKTIELYDKLAAYAITHEQGQNILANLQKQNVLSEKTRESIAGVWQNPRHNEDSARNLFNLYNATTQVATHELAAKRFELANRIDNNVLRSLAFIASDAVRFNRMATPVIETPIESLALN